MYSSKLAYSVDEVRFPLVVMAPTDHVGDDEALGCTYQAFEALLDRRRPFVMTLDLRGGASTPARRRRLRDWREKNAYRVRPYLIAVGVVVETQLERGFVTATLWLITPAFPIKTFTSRADAEPWLLDAYTNRARLLLERG